jgi:hypothetical protein
LALEQRLCTSCLCGRLPAREGLLTLAQSDRGLTSYESADLEAAAQDAMHQVSTGRKQFEDSHRRRPVTQPRPWRPGPARSPRRQPPRQLRSSRPSGAAEGAILLPSGDPRDRTLPLLPRCRRPSSADPRSRQPASVIAGQSGERTAGTPILSAQNGTNRPQLRPTSMIACQNWRYPPQMTRNDGNSRSGCGTKRDEIPHRDGSAGPLTRMTRNVTPTGRWASLILSPLVRPAAIRRSISISRAVSEGAARGQALRAVTVPPVP